MLGIWKLKGIHFMELEAVRHLRPWGWLGQVTLGLPGSWQWPLS